MILSFPDLAAVRRRLDDRCKAGDRYSDLAREIGVSHTTIVHLRHPDTYGTSYGHRTLHKLRRWMVDMTEIQRAVEAFVAGARLANAAHQYGCDPSEIEDALRAMLRRKVRGS